MNRRLKLYDAMLTPVLVRYPVSVTPMELYEQIKRTRIMLIEEDLCNFSQVSIINTSGISDKRLRTWWREITRRGEMVKITLNLLT